MTPGEEEEPATRVQGALDGLLVVDFGRVLAAPYATMLMADLGAEVVKIERPRVGDDTRSWGPPFASGESSYFLSVNRNKRSMAIDLSDPAQRQVIIELAARADVVVENFRPGVMARLGLSYEHLAQTNPGLIYCSVTGFGSHEGAHLPGYDLVIQAMGGLMSITGTDSSQPVKAGVAVVDVLTGLHAAVGVLSALYHRQQTGEGQRVEVNLLGCLLSSMVNQATGYTTAGVVPGITGNRHPSVAPYEVFPTADQPLVLAVGNDRQFKALCRVLGMPGIADDPRFATNPERLRHVEALVALLRERLQARSAAAWFDALTAVGVPCGPLNDLAGAFDLASRLGLAPTVSFGPGSDSIDLVSNPISLSRTPVTYRRRPPRLGEHTGDLTDLGRRHEPAMSAMPPAPGREP